MLYRFEQLKQKNVKIPMNCKLALKSLQQDVKTVNTMSKLGVGLNFIGLSVIPSAIATGNIGDALDTVESINHNDNKYIDRKILTKKIKKIKRIQGATLGCDIATLFIIPAIITIPISIILNAVNWNKTG